jgi:hypothetical protein
VSDQLALDVYPAPAFVAPTCEAPRHLLMQVDGLRYLRPTLHGPVLAAKCSCRCHSGQNVPASPGARGSEL